MTLRAFLLIASLAAPLAAQEPAAEAPPATPTERLDDLLARLADAEAQDSEQTARRIIDLWSQSGSDSMNLLLQRGREAMESEEIDKAVQHFSALVTLAPDFAEGWNARATAHFLDEELGLAMHDIARTLAIEPRHFGALTGLSIILERVGDEAGALRAARAALAVNPHLEEADEMVKRLAPKIDGRDI